ncbi:hypothetical protein EHP00_2209 [Ecytonucleospora hepatopenaei]|uniref:Uncharacterized protein n=1 Tax=Ecytonucleospora hepatopenaei TaxID=646526 RepID=A0A1W0E4V5_9MICR|nr:hypothetical protein EHP00_2209 [Ecytonucleospora hepatopenaei]
MWPFNLLSNLFNIRNNDNSRNTGNNPSTSENTSTIIQSTPNVTSTEGPIQNKHVKQQTVVTQDYLLIKEKQADGSIRKRWVTSENYKKQRNQEKQQKTNADGHKLDDGKWICDKCKKERENTNTNNSKDNKKDNKRKRRSLYTLRFSDAGINYKGGYLGEINNKEDDDKSNKKRKIEKDD